MMNVGCNSIGEKVGMKMTHITGIVALVFGSTLFSSAMSNYAVIIAEATIEIPTISNLYLTYSVKDRLQGLCDAYRDANEEMGITSLSKCEVQLTKVIPKPFIGTTLVISGSFYCANESGAEVGSESFRISDPLVLSCEQYSRTSKEIALRTSATRSLFDIYSGIAVDNGDNAHFYSPVKRKPD